MSVVSVVSSNTMSVRVDAVPSPNTPAAYDTRSAWRFVKQVEAYIVALEHFRIVVNRVPELLADSTWEERDALAEEVRAAEGAARAARPYRFDETTPAEALADELQAAKGAKEWALHQRLGELIEVLVGLGRWLTDTPHPPPTLGGGAASTSPVAE